MNTRRLGTADAEVAVALVKTFHGRDVSAAHMAKFLSNPSNVLLVAEADGAVIGCLSAYRLDSLQQDAAAMFIYDVDVDAGHRRKGVGTALMGHIGRLADEAQSFEMFVFTNHSNKGAVAFYQATGGQMEEGDELMFVYPRPSVGPVNKGTEL